MFGCAAVVNEPVTRVAVKLFTPLILLAVKFPMRATLVPSYAKFEEPPKSTLFKLN